MFARILRQSFRRQRRRKSLAALAVVAGMAVASAMLTLRVSLGDDLSAELRHIGANIVVSPASDSLPVTLNGVDLRPAGSGALLPESDLPRVKTIFWTNNLVAFAPVLDTQAQVAGQTVPVEGTYFDHPLLVPGSGRTIHTGIRQLDTAWSVQGAWPSDTGRQVLLGVQLARRLGLSVGSAFTATEAGRAAALQVSGVVSTGGAEDGEIVAPLPWAQFLAAQPGRYRQLLVSAITKPEDAFARQDPSQMSPADQERWMCSPYAVTIATQLAQALPGASATVVRPVADSEGAILNQLHLLIWFITALALVASALAISGAMTAAVLERKPEIALMKAVGAQDQSIGALFFSEAALLGLGGGLVGFLLGELLALAIAVRVLGHPIAWKPALAPLILALAALVTLLGSLQPLRQAMRMDPAITLRGEV
ncbi:MAG TPA: ABC transporter permease [Terriglobales bacterium]|nr:ABC transporter permease [Terriglobales bacterium]